MHLMILNIEKWMRNNYFKLPVRIQLYFYPTEAIHQRIKVCNIVVIPSV